MTPVGRYALLDPKSLESFFLGEDDVASFHYVCWDVPN